MKYRGCEDNTLSKVAFNKHEDLSLGILSINVKSSNNNNNKTTRQHHVSVSSLLYKNNMTCMKTTDS